jgi:hypothetical protein
MLIPQSADGISTRRQGSLPVGIAELRRQLASPGTMSNGHRQRLLELTTRLAHVQALGDEYARVGLSTEAAMTLSGAVASV